MTCAHAFYSVVDHVHKGMVVWKNHTFAKSVLAVPGYIGDLPDTEFDLETKKLTLTINNAPYGYSVVNEYKVLGT